MTFRSSRLFWALSLLLLGGGCLWPTLENRPAPPPPETAAAARPKELLPPGIHFFELANGVKLIVHESRASGLVTIDTWVGTGSANEAAANNGVSHFLEHLLFKGSQRFGPREIDQRLESLGAEINAATSDDFTHYHVTVAARYFEQALDVHADMVLRPTIPEGEVDAERKVVIEEINRANDEPYRKLYLEMQKLLYKVHPYGLDTLGPAEVIASIPRQKIVEYYEHWYVPGNLTVVVAGAVDAERVKQLIERHFGVAPAAPLPKTERPEEPPMEEARSATIEDDVAKAYIALAWHAPKASDLDDGAALDVAAFILGQGESSRLYQRLVERERLAIDVRASNYGQRDSGLFFVYALCEPQNAEKVRAAILEEITYLSRTPAPDSELSKAIFSLDRDFVYDAEMTDRLTSLYGYFATLSDFTDVFHYRERLKRIDSLRVIEAARHYLRPDRLAMVRLLPKGTDVSKIAPAPAATAAVAPSAPTASAPQISRSVLANGAVLIVKQNPGSEVLAFQGLLAGGARVAPKAGLTDLLARTVLKGTKLRTAEAIAREIESAGAELSVDAEEDYLSFKGKGLKGDLSHLFVLLRDVFYNATFPEEELAKEREQLLAEIRLSRDRPSGVAFEEARLALFPNHPYGNVGKRIEKDLPGISRQDVVDFYQALVRPKRLTLTVVGDVNVEEVSALVSELFPSRGEKAPDVLRTPKPEQAPASPVTVRVPMDTAQTWVVQSYLAPGIQDADFPVLKLLAALLGQGLSSRLFVDLRDLRGLAYATSATYQGSIDPLAFSLYIGTDPRNTRAVQEGFDLEIQRLQNEPVPEKELSDAKQKLIGAFELAHETSAAQAFFLGFYEMSGRGFAFDTTYPQLIESVTSADLQRVAKKYFSAPYVRTIVGPKDQIAETARLPGLSDIPVIPETERARVTIPHENGR